MPSTFSPLKIQLMATGENNTTWGDVTNLNLGTALEEAVVGSADVTFASADVTLTLTDTNASQTARNMRLRCTGTTGGSTRNLIVPSIEKPYIVKNDCADSVVVKTAAGTGITVPAGKTTWVYSDATNVVDATTHLSSLTLGTDLAVSDGGTGASTFTANGVIYGNTTSALLATAAGTTGQVLVGNTGAAPSWATLTGIGVTSFSAGTTGLTPSTATTGAITLAGTLGVANGGTGTTTAFTAGSVVFAGASGVYSQDNANLFWDDTNNRLGIGTTSPDNKLEVTVGDNAGINIEQASANQTGFFNFRDADGALAGRISYDHSNNSMRLATNETEKVRITSAGDVGIGTSSPGAKLDVAGLDNSGAQYRTSTRTIGIGSISGVNALYGGSGTELTFHIAIERMRITSAGLVGIGTTAPSTKLHVTRAPLTGAATRPNAVITLEDTANTELYLVSENTGNGQLRFGDTDSNYRGAVTYRHATDHMEFITAASERMRINSSGLVGIGTAAPTAKLHVFDTGSSTEKLIVRGPETGSLADFSNGLNANFLVKTATSLTTIGPSVGAGLAFQTTGTERMRITSAGQLCVGRTSSLNNGALSVLGTGAQAITTQVTVDGNSLFQGYSASTTLAFQVIGTGQGYFAGNVGIGTTSPNTKLAVEGSACEISINDTAGTIAGLRFRTSGATKGVIQADSTSNLRFSSGATEAMRILSSGNVGIGTSSPIAKLDVVGSGLVTKFGSSSALSAYTGWQYNSTTLGYVGNGSGVASGAGATDFAIGSTGARALVFGSNDTERARIDSAGDVGIGTATPDIFGRFYTRTVGINSSGTSMLQINGTTYGGIDLGFNGTRTATMLAETGGFYLQTNTAAAMSLGTNGLERMRIDSSGNVLVGTTTANGRLSVVGDQISITSGAGSATLGLQIKGTALTAIPAGQIQGYIATGDSGIGTAGDLLLAPRTDIACNIRFITGASPAERMRIDSSGNLLVGKTASSGGVNGFEANASGFASTASGTFAGWMNRKTSDGDILLFNRDATQVGSVSVTTTATAYNTSSDYRLKDIDGPISNSGTYIDALKPVQGSWKSDGSRFIGLLAHEVQEVSETPIATGEKDGEEMQAMDYSAPELIANLIAEIQSLRARVAQLEGN